MPKEICSLLLYHFKRITTKEFYTEQNFAFGLDDLAYIQDYLSQNREIQQKQSLKF